MITQASNTTATLAPQGTTGGSMQKTTPEPIEIAKTPVIVAKLAEQGLRFDEAKIEADTRVRASQLEKIAQPVYQTSQPIQPAVKPDESGLTELKAQINDSFSEVANILLELQARFQLLDERIEIYNRKGGHKL